MLKTCTPYLAGNVPVMGEHCAWMESSAVVFCNSVIGGRTNCEGRESTSAAMLAKRSIDVDIPADELSRRNGPGWKTPATGYLDTFRHDVRDMSTGGVLVPAKE